MAYSLILEKYEAIKKVNMLKKLKRRRVGPYSWNTLSEEVVYVSMVPQTYINFIYTQTSE